MSFRIWQLWSYSPLQVDWCLFGRCMVGAMQIMRSNAGHSMVEAKMLDFQVLIFVTSFWLQPTRSKAGLLLQVFQIGASDTPTVRWNRGMQFDCRLGPGTSHWQLLHKRLRFRGTHTMNFFAPTRQSIFCDMAGMSTAIQFTHTISKNSHFSGRPRNGFVQSGAIPTQNLKSFWSLCESSNFWTAVNILVACSSLRRLCKSSECCCCPLYQHRSKGLGIPSVWDYIADILLLSTNRCTKTNIQLQNGPEQNICLWRGCSVHPQFNHVGTNGR